MVGFYFIFSVRRLLQSGQAKVEHLLFAIVVHSDECRTVLAFIELDHDGLENAQRIDGQVLVDEFVTSSVCQLCGVQTIAVEKA